MVELGQMVVADLVMEQQLTQQLVAVGLREGHGRKVSV